VALAPYFDIVPYLLINHVVTGKFLSILNRSFERIPNKTVLQYPSEGSKPRTADVKDLIFPFIYGGMIRPWNYLCHFLYTFLTFYIEGLKAQTDINLIALGFGFDDSVPSEERKKNQTHYFKFQKQKVPPSLFMKYIEDVDRHHFDNIDDEGSEFHHLRTKIMKLVPVPDRLKPVPHKKSQEVVVVKDFKAATVADVFPEKWDAAVRRIERTEGILRKGRGHILRTCLRTALLEDLVKAVAIYGVNPVIRAVPSAESKKKLSE
jgi:hypothetical protein